MAVKRKRSETFDFPTIDLSETVLKVLEKRQRWYRYTNTTVVSKNRIVTTIKQIGWPLLLATRFDVEIVPEGTGLNVIAETTSQYSIWGDVFQFYNGYIRDFFAALNRRSIARS